jgi:hypothetical protein
LGRSGCCATHRRAALVACGARDCCRGPRVRRLRVQRVAQHLRKKAHRHHAPRRCVRALCQRALTLVSPSDGCSRAGVYQHMLARVRDAQRQLASFHEHAARASMRCFIRERFARIRPPPSVPRRVRTRHSCVRRGKHASHRCGSSAARLRLHAMPIALQRAAALQHDAAARGRTRGGGLCVRLKQKFDSASELSEFWLHRPAQLARPAAAFLRRTSTCRGAAAPVAVRVRWCARAVQAHAALVETLCSSSRPRCVLPQAARRARTTQPRRQAAAAVAAASARSFAQAATTRASPNAPPSTRHPQRAATTACRRRRAWI